MKTQKKKIRWLKWTGIISGSLLVLFIIFCLVVDHFVQFRMSDAEYASFFKKNHLAGKIKYYNTHGRTMRYITIGNDSLPTLLFIHGSPASSSIYADYYKDTAFSHHFKIIAVDRPGYGNSGLGHPEPIQTQAAMIRPVLDSMEKVTRPVLLMAGSYGTSVACRLVMDNPNLVDGLVLVAPSLAPGEETIYSVSWIAQNPAVYWFLPRMIQSANTEKLAHKKELTKMLPLWKNIHVPVFYLQGDKDELIDTTNASFAKRQLVNAPFLHIEFIKGQPHFIAYTAERQIKQRILTLYDMLKAKK